MLRLKEKNQKTVALEVEKKLLLEKQSFEKKMEEIQNYTKTIELKLLEKESEINEGRKYFSHENEKLISELKELKEQLFLKEEQSRAEQNSFTKTNLPLQQPMHAVDRSRYRSSNFQEEKESFLKEKEYYLREIEALRQELQEKDKELVQKDLQFKEQLDKINDKIDKWQSDLKKMHQVEAENAQIKQ